MNKHLRQSFLLATLCCLVTMGAMAQPRHAIVLQPTRILNAYFPEAGVAYQYRLYESQWTIGGALGYVADGPHLYRRALSRPGRTANGLGGNVEARYVIAEPKEGTTLSLAANLSHSQLNTRRDFALVPTDEPGVATFGDTRVTAWRTEFGLGLSRQRRWDSGFTFEWYIGVCTGRRGWRVPQGIDLAPASLGYEFSERQGFYGDGNEGQPYVLPRLRIGFGYCWGQ